MNIDTDTLPHIRWSKHTNHGRGTLSIIASVVVDVTTFLARPSIFVIDRHNQYGYYCWLLVRRSATAHTERIDGVSGNGRGTDQALLVLEVEMYMTSNGGPRAYWQSQLMPVAAGRLRENMRTMRKFKICACGELAPHRAVLSPRFSLPSSPPSPLPSPSLVERPLPVENDKSLI